MKKLISVILTSAMTVSIFAASVSAVEYGEEYTNKPTKTYSQKFNDVPTSHWAFSYVGEMTERGVVSGYPNGNFYPDNNVTRAEFARIMTSASGLPISTPQTRDFSDVAPDAWYAPYIHAAYPYLSGYQIYGGNYYKPNTPALREDIAVALVKLKGYDTLGADESILTTMFTDANSISSEARKYVAVALERGLVSGYEDNTFRGQDSISRAEATAMLWRAYQYGNDNKTFDNVPTAAPIITPAPTPINYERDDNDWKPSDEPVTTPAPTYVATEKPVSTDKPMYTEKPMEGNPYIIDTITKANISDTWNFMTSDDNNTIYYYDKNDNKVYSVNIDSGKVKVLYNLYDLKMTEDKTVTIEDVGDEVSYYSDFVPKQLLYDTSNDRLLCMGQFSSYKDWKDISAESDYSDNGILELDDDLKFYTGIEQNCKMLCGMGNGLLCGMVKGDGWGNYEIQYKKYNLENGEEEINFISWAYFLRDSYQSRMEYMYNFANNELYVVQIDTMGNEGSIVYKYNFTNQRFEKIQSANSSNEQRVGCNNGRYYFWDTQMGEIIECASNGKLTQSAINTKENVDIIDFKTVSKDVVKLCVSNNGNIVFYDNNSIRVIKER